MSIEDFLVEMDDEASTVLSPNFDIDVVETDYVPAFDDPTLTFDNLDEGRKGCKRLTTCVLYVDIRNSAQISAERQPQTLARMYSAFVRSMIRCAEYFGGHVRNIIGDRVMVLFDAEDCFTAAMDTAALCNTVAHGILNRRIKSFPFRCGIGVDYGPMLVVKAGAVRRGALTEFYRSLVWLGRPANIAARLTDRAHKTVTSSVPTVRAGIRNPLGSWLDWTWREHTQDEFLGLLKPTYAGPTLVYPDPNFAAFVTSSRYSSVAYPPVLVTEAVLNGYRKARGQPTVAREGWRPVSLVLPEYGGKVFGADVQYVAAKDGARRRRA